jgi:hypothetical protein
MAPRPLRGLDAIREATEKAPPAIHVLTLDGVPRTGLSVKEVSHITGLPVHRIRTEIRNRRIRVIDGGSSYVIPVAELAEIVTWADYVDIA